MSTGKLLLHPQSVTMVPPSQWALTAEMQRLGLFGDVLGGERMPPRFLAGERFLQLISFLGCSPHINLEPPADGGSEFCYLEVLGPWEQARFLQGRNTRPPACPVCKRTNPAWRDRMECQEIQASATEWTCNACGNRSFPSQWNWRQQAGFGRLFIQINSIFPSEAVPTDELLGSLERLSSNPWRYFYIQD